MSVGSTELPVLSTPLPSSAAASAVIGPSEPRSEGQPQDCPAGFRDIVFAPLIEWGTMPYWRWRSLFRAVAASGHRVLWADHFGPWGKMDRLRSIWRHPRQLRPALWEAEPGIFVLSSPLRVPPGETRGSQLARALAVAAVRRAIRRLDFRRPLLWISGPTGRALLGQLGECGAIYDCVDDLASLGVPHSLLDEEMKLLRGVDLVLTCNPVVEESKRGYGVPVLRVPNGVDPEHFNVADRPGPTAGRLAHLPRPVLGYQGVLYDRIDWTLVEFICRSLPAWTVVFMGRITASIPAAITALPNCHILGEVAYVDVPDYYRAMDVLWLPHKVNDITARQSTLKVYEYLAAGRPTVSTDIYLEPDVRKVVRIGRTPQEILDSVCQAVREDSPEQRAARREVALQSSWAVRFALMRRAILEAVA